MRSRFFIRVACLASVLAAAPTAAVRAGEVHVAVASNFAGTLKEIAARFEKASGHHVTSSSASSGAFYAQIKSGAPFDVLLSADAERPKLLLDEGLAVKDSGFTYAVGKLALWSSDKDLVDGEGKVLGTDKFKHLAIANPATAPYGLAAKQTLEKLKLWDPLVPRIVQGENISQTLQFVESSAAELGFIAVSQVREIEAKGKKGSVWLVPAELHAPINQDAVLLTRAKDNAAAADFLKFLKSKEIRKLIAESGYSVP